MGSYPVSWKILAPNPLFNSFLNPPSHVNLFAIFKDNFPRRSVSFCVTGEGNVVHRMNQLWVSLISEKESRIPSDVIYFNESVDFSTLKQGLE
jgi:hypothetical protein